MNLYIFQIYIFELPRTSGLQNGKSQPCAIHFLKMDLRAHVFVNFNAGLKADWCHLNPMGYSTGILLISLIFSVTSSLVGILKFLKRGPIRLLPKNKSYKAQLIVLCSVFFNWFGREFSIFFAAMLHPASDDLLKFAIYWCIIFTIFEFILVSTLCM